VGWSYGSCGNRVSHLASRSFVLAVPINFSSRQPLPVCTSWYAYADTPSSSFLPRNTRLTFDSIQDTRFRILMRFMPCARICVAFACHDSWQARSPEALGTAVSSKRTREERDASVQKRVVALFFFSPPVLELSHTPLSQRSSVSPLFSLRKKACPIRSTRWPLNPRRARCSSPAIQRELSAPMTYFFSHSPQSCLPFARVCRSQKSPPFRPFPVLRYVCCRIARRDPAPETRTVLASHRCSPAYATLPFPRPKRSCSPRPFFFVFRTSE